MTEDDLIDEWIHAIGTAPHTTLSVVIHLIRQLASEH